MKNHTKSDESVQRDNGSGVRQALLDLLDGRPELAAQYGQFQAAFADQGLVPERLLDICRLRIDALHQLTAIPATVLTVGDAERVRAGDFSMLATKEVAALTIAEQLMIDAHGVSSEQIAELAKTLGEPGAVTLLTAIAIFDANARMQRVLQPLRERRVAANC